MHCQIETSWCYSCCRVWPELAKQLAWVLMTTAMAQLWGTALPVPCLPFSLQLTGSGCESLMKVSNLLPAAPRTIPWCIWSILWVLVSGVVREAPQTSKTQIIFNVYETDLSSFRRSDSPCVLGHRMIQKDFGISLADLISVLQDRERR